jgi:hypothetical protein
MGLYEPVGVGFGTGRLSDVFCRWVCVDES